MRLFSVKYCFGCCLFAFCATALSGPWPPHSRGFYEGWNFNSGNYLFTTDTK